MFFYFFFLLLSLSVLLFPPLPSLFSPVLSSPGQLFTPRDTSHS